MLLHREVALFPLIIFPTLAFTTNINPFRIRPSILLHATPTSTQSELVSEIDKALSRNQNPEVLLQQLETFNKLEAPNRSPQHNGLWYVWYTDCPPPSNGKLGPFSGSAQQFIPMEDGNGYQNLLNVNNWLTATLDGVWEEWDGQLLVADATDEERDARKRASRDWGADHWKVTFITLQIAFFGFPLLTKTFPSGTSRIWRTTFLDDNIRIVRAGKTGRLKDEVVFYTKRTPPPPDGKVVSPV